VAQLIHDQNQTFGIFSIVETNSFKHINHLSLKFIPGTDYTTKQYLAQVVKDLKTEREILEKKLSVSTADVSLYEKTVKNLSFELEQLKIHQAEELSRLKLRNAEELAVEKEKASKEKDNLRNLSERSQREIQKNHENQVFHK
jgi:spindle assembly abnormal protein 6